MDYLDYDDNCAVEDAKQAYFDDLYKYFEDWLEEHGFSLDELSDRDERFFYEEFMRNGRCGSTVMSDLGMSNRDFY